MNQEQTPGWHTNPMSVANFVLEGDVAVIKAGLGTIIHANLSCKEIICCDIVYRN